MISMRACEKGFLMRVKGLRQVAPHGQQMPSDPSRR